MTAWLRAIAFLSLIGLCVSLALNLVQQDIESFAAACQVAEGFDCEPALKSRYGKWFGIPLSAFAFAYYLLLGALAIQGVLLGHRRERNVLLLLLLSSFNVALVAWLVYVSVVRLKAYCVFCLVLHILAPLLLIFSIGAFGKRTRSVRETIAAELATVRENLALVVGLIAVGALVLGGLAHFERLSREKILDDHPQYRQVLEGTYPRYSDWDTLVAGRPFLGREDAPVTIVEFADFTCPVCAQASAAFGELSRIYDIKRVFIAYPRSSECNPYREDQMPGACFGALGASFASRRGRLWRYHDSVFENPSLLDPGRETDLAHAAGAASWDEFVGDSDALRMVARDIEFARAAGVSAVPTIFVNGMGFPGLPDMWYLEAAIEGEIRRSKKEKIR